MPAATDAAAAVDPVPLCVDLDGSLIATDALWESLMLLVKQRPGDVARLPFWVIGGKANFKRQVSDRVSLNAAALPYRQDLLEFLREQKQAGRRLILATASDHRIAQAVADHLGIFDEVIATTESVNCAGDNKLKVIRERCGPGGFDYVGNSAADLPLWKAARRAYVVSAGGGLLKRAADVCEPARVFPRQGGQLKPLLKAMRPHQWAKNVLLGVPLVMSHQLNLHSILSVVFAFYAFSCVASGIYITNDLLDLEADRQHPLKRRRPFAAGTLAIPRGIALAVLLFASGFAIALTCLPVRFVGMLALYLALSTSYTMFFKRKLLLDVFLVAGLYAHRILAGGVAASITVSPWLLAFSMFFFVSLAFLKRYSELKMMKAADSTKARGRSYGVGDMEIFKSIGPTSGYMAVLVFALYIKSPEVGLLYPNAQVLWLVCPLLLYWITRLWFLVERHPLPDDPVIFALTDRVSYVVGALTLLAVLGATLPFGHKAAAAASPAAAPTTAPSATLH